MGRGSRPGPGKWGVERLGGTGARLSRLGRDLCLACEPEFVLHCETPGRARGTRK